MAQVSSNLMAYDQIFLKIRDFMILEKTNSFKTNEERIEKYNQLLSEIYQGISGPMTKFDPYIKGEPPISSKINKFSKDLANDMNVIAEHVDYLVAKTINTFNLFSTEIENEKRYAERIASKAKILQMYTQSPSNDVVYLGDSFDNADQVDFNRVKINFNPHIYNGSFSLPIVKSRLWSPNRVSITSSDGGQQSVATTVVNETSGWLHLSAAGFTFSSPTLKVKLTQDANAVSPAPIPSAEPSVSAEPAPQIPTAPVIKKSTITCVKGKTTKKVSAVSPKCPAGFKKKA